jgi:hypothetical protein
MKLLPILLVPALLSLAPMPAATGQGEGDEGWRSFAGSWSASGHRQSLDTEAGRPAFTVYLSGAVTLEVAAGLSRGFRGEVIGFDDGARASVGRSVWTDERGDRIFGMLTGETIATGRRVTGTITGGTGRYAGITGEYSLDWQYVVSAEGGVVQGRAVGLKGRYRAAGVRR